MNIKMCKIFKARRDVLIEPEHRGANNFIKKKNSLKKELYLC